MGGDRKDMKKKTHPKPEVKREPLHENCIGCERIFEMHDTDHSMDVCMAYQYPSLKWRHYRVETETKKVKGEDKTIFYHYNPCPAATHIEHSPKPEDKRLRVKRK